MRVGNEVEHPFLSHFLYFYTLVVSFCCSFRAVLGRENRQGSGWPRNAKMMPFCQPLPCLLGAYKSVVKSTFLRMARRLSLWCIVAAFPPPTPSIRNDSYDYFPIDISQFMRLDSSVTAS